MLVKVSELRDMEVVSIQDGRRLGLIMDIELDLDEGRILALIPVSYTHLDVYKRQDL